MISLRSASLEAIVLPVGATLAGLWLAGTPRSLVLGFPDPADFGNHPIYAGAVVGPIANRIADGHVRIGETEWQMERNNAGNCLHSGRDGLHGRAWDVTGQSASQVSLCTELEHGVGGLPGHRRFEAHYSLSDDGVLDLRLDAISDQDTPVNLAHHPYWTLDDRGTIASHRLYVAAATYLPTTPALVPTGEIAPVDGTVCDFRTARPVPDDRILDANLCLTSGRRTRPAHAATLTGADGVTLRIETTEPGLQVYNGNALPTSEAQVHPGQHLAPFSAMALEPQGWPDAPHHANFPSILLKKGARYRQHTRYHFSRATTAGAS